MLSWVGQVMYFSDFCRVLMLLLLHASDVTSKADARWAVVADSLSWRFAQLLQRLVRYPVRETPSAASEEEGEALRRRSCLMAEMEF